MDCDSRCDEFQILNSLVLIGLLDPVETSYDLPLVSSPYQLLTIM